MTGPFARNVIGFVIDINLGNRKLIRFSGAIIPLSLRITRSHKPAFRFQTICTIVHCSTLSLSLATRVSPPLRDLLLVLLSFARICSAHDIVPMPSYCLQDCHYFYRTALRLLSIPTFLASRYA
ncbi:hypothetical protein DTO006G1_2462 [Penicillium roqueforti]|nr:hypothetical protein CBS147337_2480 [Penicillium roqueforti]KAI2762525.1 hypothetical protein DTO006G1_2462 [Penicillium roqueforti]KAI3234388.1 hypothetical protein DTO012A9_7570 [Penicillium roqueforti]KAI3239746.1 hypothetical protein CBS147310_2376 [Penicillium roqueforti]KAI3252849.1 hypothetical protein DTO006G7_6373 [Penicillium roqueforti]